MNTRTTTAGALALLGALILSACSPVGVTDYNPPQAPTATQEAEPVVTPEPEPEPPAPAAEEGTREQPFPYGFVASIYDGAESNVIWDIRVDQPYVATSEIANENQFNPAPQPGNDYVAIPVNIVWQGTEPMSPWADFEYGLSVAFVTADGVTIEESFVVQPWPSVMDIADLYQGGSADFVTVVEAPQGATGTVRVTVGYDYDAFWG